MRDFLTTDASTLVYKNMILPILEYGDVFLTAASKVNRDRFQKLQNKALRISQGVDKRYDTDQLHKDSNLLKLKYRREQHLLKFMYNKCDGGDPTCRRVSRRKG